MSISGPPGTQIDFDFLLLDLNNELVAISGQPNFNGDAFEDVRIPSPGIYNLFIAFYRSNGTGLEPDGSIIKWISFGATFNSVEPGPVDKATIIGPANAPGVAAAAAAFRQQTFGQLVAEPFTSLGGVPILFDTNGNCSPEPISLPQPRFTGPDGYVHNIKHSVIVYYIRVYLYRPLLIFIVLCM
jgi:hypothetical protein